MRIAAVNLPDLRIEVVRASEPESDARGAGGARLDGVPLAIVVAPAPLTEAKLLGNTRLDVVSAEAKALGVRAGQTIAQARARAANLAVRVVRPDRVSGELARLAEVALAFGATVSFSSNGSSNGKQSSYQGSYGDVVWVDVTGCAHLHASQDNDGEAVLASRLSLVFRGLGHECAVAVADGPRVAAILARAATSACDPRRRSEDPPLVVVPSGKNAVALAPLSVSALPLLEEDVRWLTKVGVRTVGELLALPRSALAARLGAHAAVVLGLAEGDDRAPLAPYVPPIVPEEETTLEYGIEGTEALTFVAKTLADRLASRLAGRAVAAARIELDLLLDTALLPDASREPSFSSGEQRRVQRVVLDLPAPLSAASDLLAALRPKIDRLELLAPVLGAKLRAPMLVHKPQAALSLFEPQPKVERALPRLVAELASDLGEEAVGKLSLGDAWVPEDRSRLVKLETRSAFGDGMRGGARGEERKRRHMISSVPEPTRILAQPVPVPRDEVKIVRHLSRMEAVDWWKRLPDPRERRPARPGPREPREPSERRRGVDYVYAWVDEGAAWVEIDRATGGARIRGWFD